MQGLSGPQGSGAWRFQCVCVAGVVVLAAFVVVLTSELAWDSRRLVSDVGLLGGGLAAAVSCGYRWRRCVGRRRRSWMFFAAAGMLAALGNSWILAVHLASWPKMAEAPGDAFFALALASGVAGMAAFPAARRRGTDLGRMMLDGVVMGGSLFLLVSAVFPQVLARVAQVSEVGLSGLLPIVDIAVATFAALLILRVSRADRATLALLGGGCTLYGVTDLAAAVLDVPPGSFSYGTVVDVGWIAGYLVIALAAHHPDARGDPGVGDVREVSALIGTVLMFAVFLGALVVSPPELRGGTVNVASAILWLVVVAGIAVRQILLIVDNDRLRHGLEHTVRERTLALGRAIRRSELLLTSVGDGIYGVDRAGQVTFVNPAGARALGVAPAELVGKAAHATFHAPKIDGTPFPVELCYITEALRDSSVTTAEEDAYRRADGQTFPVEVTATPMASPDGVEGSVVVFRDITQRLEVERLKSEFVSIVSHELRTPLTSIRGSLGLLAGGALGPLPAKAVTMVNVALASCARLTRLVNDILDIERIESGTMPMNVADHPADLLIDAAVSQLDVLAAEAGVRLAVTSCAGVVHADADRVVQTLVNLLGNAIKFSPPGSTVEVASTIKGGFVEFRVRDHGRGIPQAKLNAIFDRFAQVDPSDATVKGGSGLGLAISRGMVERLNGHLWAESAEGAGTTLRFTLPRTDASAQPDPTDPTPPPANRPFHLSDDLDRHAPAGPAAANMR